MSRTPGPTARPLGEGSGGMKSCKYRRKGERQGEGVKRHGHTQRV